MIPGTNTDVDASMNFIQGETWGGIPQISITVGDDEIPPTNDAVSAIMQFSMVGGGRTLAITSVAGQITISSASGWTFVVPQQSLDLQAGDYTWAFQVTDIAGNKNTYLKSKEPMVVGEKLITITP